MSKMVHPVALVMLPIVFGLCVIRKFREYQWGHCKSSSPLTGRVFLITGSNSGIGKETARSLAARNACVIMACRDMSRARNAISEIRQTTPAGTLVPMQLDLASMDSIRAFAREVLELFPQIHVLINNAGVYVPLSANQKTSDGYEINFGVNHLGHFLLTELLMDRLKESAPSRIVVVSSGLFQRGVIDIDDLNMVNRKKTIGKKFLNAGYCASKLANVYHARELAHRLKGTGVEVYALCPGFTYTNIFRNSNISWWHYIVFFPVAFFFMRSANQGAQTVLYCATSEEVQGRSGAFFRNCSEYHSCYVLDPETQTSLWRKSEEFVKKP